MLRVGRLKMKNAIPHPTIAAMTEAKISGASYQMGIGSCIASTPTLVLLGGGMFLAGCSATTNLFGAPRKKTVRTPTELIS